MKRKYLTLLLTAALSLGLLTGCGNREVVSTDAEQNETDGQEVAEETADQEEEPTEEVVEPEASDQKVTIRIASLKGPTSIGLLKLWEDQDQGLTQGSYEYAMATAADEIMPRMIQGDLDIALLPANAAAVLYQKSQGAVTVIDINTLGVLYLVSGDTSITGIADLKGKTVYLTGKGTTPDYALQHLLLQNDVALDEVTLEYRSEATEVAALLQEDPNAIGLLPQPFVTAACKQNEALSVVLDINEEWELLHDGQGLVTGVTVVRTAFLEENPEAVELFMEEHKASAAFANSDVETTAEYMVKRGIVEKAPIAAAAIPKCNITYIDGEEMKAALSTYLSILFEQNPEFIGGAMPGEDFYTVP